MLRQDMAAMQLQLAEEGAARRGVEQQRASLEQQLASERASRQGLEQQSVSLQQQLVSERSARVQLQEQMNNRLSELAGAERQVAAAQAAQAALQAQLNAAQAALAELQSRLEAAEAKQRQGVDAAQGEGQAAATADTASVHRLEPGNAQDLLAQVVTLQAQVRGGSPESDRPDNPCCNMQAARLSRHLAVCELAMQSAEAWQPGSAAFRLQQCPSGSPTDQVHLYGISSNLLLGTLTPALVHIVFSAARLSVALRLHSTRHLCGLQPLHPRSAGPAAASRAGRCSPRKGGAGGKDCAPGGPGAAGCRQLDQQSAQHGGRVGAPALFHCGAAEREHRAA